ncbi:MAG TPA: NAD(P)/FAD-dependent oxidoreductase [Bacteriovoracaceae bacterium]|nr:NAD(P)/FAD-dependent oxidoreductase [Bacteriovoracaceae bacterium]
MEESRKILIAGAGLVGSLLAIALKKRGHEVWLFEKRSDMRKETHLAGKSINLIITAKGIKPLRTLGLWEKVEAITSPVMGRMIHSKAGEDSYQPYGKDKTEFNNSVSRAELNRLLMTEAEKVGVKILFNSPLKSLDLKNKVASFENAEPMKYDLLFGADGTGSATRQALIEALGDKANYKVEPLGTDYKEMTLPAKNGTYAMDEHSLHIWPRGNHMLMGLPNKDGTFTMTLYMPQGWFEEFKSPVAFENYFKTNYPDAAALMPDHVSEYASHPQGFLGIVRMKPWIYEDQVALVGDAAHAMVPFFGQGMNSGFSDIQYLLDEMDKHSGDYSTIFKNYNEVQKLSGDAIADMSRENFAEMCEKVGDEKFQLRKKVEHKIESAFPDKFRSRYGLVTYTLVPYHLAKEIGAIQDELLDELCEDILSIDQLDLNKAKKLIDDKIGPWFSANKLTIERFK